MIDNKDGAINTLNTIGAVNFETCKLLKKLLVEGFNI